MKKLLIITCFVLLIIGCKKEEQANLTSVTNNTINQKPNILFIIADDLGKDAINGFSEGVIKPNTPNIDAIRTSGISFSNLWVYPTCTPTRASIITGKYGYRTGVKWAADELSSSEKTLQTYINENTNNSYATAIIGKWHLSGSNTTINPETFGIDYYSGLIRGSANDYYQWQLTEDGATSMQTTYITEYFTDLSINWVNNQSKPWFLWLAYTAPHTPFHVPPANMHNQGNLPTYTTGMNAVPYYMAAIEAMDYQIGRLLDSMSTEDKNNLIIIFIGDNGTPSEVAQSPYTPSTVKATLYQGGINVPLFISGEGVSRIGNDDHLITSTDFFATIASIAGVNINQINDSKSFHSLLTQSSTIRNYQYSEKDDGNEDAWTIKNNKYKLIVNANGNKEMYNIENDPYEQNNLINNTLTTEENLAKTLLEAELDSIRQ